MAPSFPDPPRLDEVERMSNYLHVPMKDIPYRRSSVYNRPYGLPHWWPRGRVAALFTMHARPHGRRCGRQYATVCLIDVRLDERSTV